MTAVSIQKQPYGDAVSGSPSAGEKSVRWWNRAWVLARRILRSGQRPERPLRVVQSLPLGERRFVAVIAFERSRFLVGGTSSSLVLLARLDNVGETAKDMAFCAHGEPCDSLEKNELSLGLAEVRQ